MMADNIIWLDFNDAPEQRDELATDTDALRAGLLDRLEAVLHYLFPQGRIRGGKFYVGDVDGNPGCLDWYEAFAREHLAKTETAV